MTTHPREREGVRSGGLRVASASMLLGLLAFAGCTTPPAPVEPQPPVMPLPLAALSVSFDDVSIRGVDIDTVEVIVRLVLENTGEAALAVRSLDWTVDPVPVAAPGIAGIASLPAGSFVPGMELAGGQSLTVPVAMTIDVPPGTGALIPLNIGVGTPSVAIDGRFVSASATWSGNIQRVLRPQLVIRSIRILKDELINTRLGVDLTIVNPNAFLLRFSGLEYRLYGEGRYWASGKIAQPFDVPPLGEAEAQLYLAMNFTDMDRSVLDRVIKLAEVAYRLQGTAGIDTGLDFFPRFEQLFDMTGRVKVIK